MMTILTWFNQSLGLFWRPVNWIVHVFCLNFQQQFLTLTGVCLWWAGCQGYEFSRKTWVSHIQRCVHYKGKRVLLFFASKADSWRTLDKNNGVKSLQTDPRRMSSTVNKMFYSSGQTAPNSPLNADKLSECKRKRLTLTGSRVHWVCRETGVTCASRCCWKEKVF